MDTTINTTKVPMPPAFMATTRQKIMLRQHHLPDDYYISTQSGTMSAIETIGNLARNIVKFARKS